MSTRKRETVSILLPTKAQLSLCEEGAVRPVSAVRGGGGQENQLQQKKH
jgi:hypothetical protein